jgi:hypothetical protein
VGGDPSRRAERTKLTRFKLYRHPEVQAKRETVMTKRRPGPIHPSRPAAERATVCILGLASGHKADNQLPPRSLHQQKHAVLLVSVALRDRALSRWASSLP